MGIVLLLVAGGWLFFNQSSTHFREERAQEGLPLVTVRVEKASGGAVIFHAELAATPKQQERGLMFRTKLAENAGMLFPFKEPKMTAFWMKNTLIPLDMVFIAEDGKIVNIARNTAPESLAPISSGKPVFAVLEIGGSVADRLGVQEGDVVVVDNNYSHAK